MDVNRHTRLNTWLLVVAIIILGFKFKYSTQIEADVLKNREQHMAEAKANRKLILDFMQRTQQRWDKLHLDNPELRVPAAQEPNLKSILSEDDLERKPE